MKDKETTICIAKDFKKSEKLERKKQRSKIKYLLCSNYAPTIGVAQSAQAKGCQQVT